MKKIIASIRKTNRKMDNCDEKSDQKKKTLIGESKWKWTEDITKTY